MKAGWRQPPADGLEIRTRIGMMPAERGRSSVVERQLPKLNVVGSIPIARSKNHQI